MPSYDTIKCPVCAHPWSEHPTDAECYRYRPKEPAPPPCAAVLANLPPEERNGRQEEPNADA